ncbi:phage portal protein [Streptococcus pluranimalium]|uniref:phage portal protein n=1 Tax=Streptococcus pluranimalium TaxID=82348 RepID=UPI003F693446
MGLVQTVKNFFKRSTYVMTNQTLSQITDHPKVAVSSQEYQRIKDNQRYFAGSYPQIEYKDSNGRLTKRDFNHLPIGRTASKKIASLVFNEQAEIKVDDEKANEFIQQQLHNDRFIKNFERYLESCLALGGLAMRPYVDKDKVRVAFIQAPVFLPLQSNTQDVSSAAIITKTIKSEGNKQKYYTLIELHEWSKDDKYTVTNELYKSDNQNIVGARVPLSELYEDLEEVVDLNGLSRPLFTYLKTPGMNNKDINSPLGLSIFDNAKTTIDFLNTTYDEFMWEVKMGQRRVAVPTQMIKTEYNQDGEKVTVKREFETGHNVYEQFDSGLDEAIKITDLTTPIRADDYIKAINEGLSLFEMQIGVSAGMFTFDGKSMKTATEIVSENSDTYQMRNSIVALVEQSLKELIISILELAKIYKLYSGNIPDMDTITINLDDGVFTDRNAELDYWMKMVTAGFAPKSMAIKKTLNVTKEEAQDIFQQIAAETMGAVNGTRSEEDLEIYGE